MLGSNQEVGSVGVGAGLYMYNVVVKKFTFVISSRHEFLFIPPWGYLVHCLFFAYTVTDFSAAEKDSDVKLCTLVRLLSAMSFSILVNFGSRGVTAVALLYRNRSGAVRIGHRGTRIRNWGRRRSVRPCGRICVLQAC